jgi:hypothetical protein
VPPVVQERYPQGDSAKLLKTQTHGASRVRTVTSTNDFCLPGARCRPDVVVVSDRATLASERGRCTT